VGARSWRVLVGTLIAGAALMGSARANAMTITISGSPANSIAAGSTYSFTPTAKDSDGTTPAFAITGKPSWATFNSTTGQLTGKPTTAGKYTNIGIAAYHGSVTSSVLWFGITVTSSSGTPTSGSPSPSIGVQISGTPATTVAVGGSYSFTPTVTDTTGGKPAFSITGKPSWATFSTTTGQLSGKPMTAGTYINIGIAAYDGKYTSSILWFGITVSSSGTTTPTITLSGTPSKSATVGQAYSFQPTAKDSAGKAVSFSVANKPSWATFSIASGLLAGTPTSAQTDSNIVISASDGSTSASMPAYTITVTATATSGGSTGAATLSWTLPTLNTNGTALTNLAGVRIYYGTSSSNLSHQIQLAGTSTTTYTIDNLASGTWYFGAAAYTTAGIQSAMSTLVSKSFP
jgi:putative Ig domain-containing protein